MIGRFFKGLLTKSCRRAYMGKVSSKKKSEEASHSRLRTNCLSRLFFCWTFPSLARGFTTGISENDLLSVQPEYDSSVLGDRLEEEWSHEMSSAKKPSLLKPLYRIFGTEFLATGLLMFVNEFLVKLSQPILIWKLITTHVGTNGDENQAYVYACLIVVASFMDVLLYNWYIFNIRTLALKVRIACSSIIYRKSLRLNKNSVNETATGHIVTLLSNDLNRFDKLIIQLPYLCAAPLEAVVILSLLYFILGFKATVGIAIFFVFIPIQVLMGKKYASLRLKTAMKTDERVHLINEIVSGIQVIKMYTLENVFIEFTNILRKQEIGYIRGTAYLRAFQNAFNKFLSKGAVFLSILFYILTGNQLESRYVFVIKSFYNLLRQCMSSDFPEAIKNIAEISVSFERIEDFLQADEIKPNKTETAHCPIGVSLKQASAKWSSSKSDTLSNINFMALPGQLISLVGTIGSGKTSLIKVILQELSLNQGAFRLKGKISYACQESWLFAGTIRENILFGQPYDVVRYNEVVRICALNHDFKILPFADNSTIGDRGITLSGGQKARISLARAVYRDADIYILDDPLAAVDTSVGKQLFEQCILDYLKDKCVILATHQIQYLQKSHWIYLLQDGKVVAQGDYEHIRTCGEDFANMLQKDMDFEHSFHDDSEKNLSVEEEERRFTETRNSGRIALKVYTEYLLSHGWFLFLLIFIMFVVTQGTQSGTDYFESLWVNIEENPEIEHPTFLNTLNCIYIYSGLICAILLCSILTSLFYYTYFMKTSIKLHDGMFSAVVKAKLDFFYKNSTGSVLNRFAKDTAIADTCVPKYLIDTIQNGLNVLSIFILVTIVDHWMAVCAAILLTLFYGIRTFYLSTSRDLKRIEAISRSPICSHLNESLNGLETIRAFSMQNKQKQTFDRLQNKNTSAFSFFLALATTFRLWLSLFCSIYVAVVTASCFWGQKIYGGNLGLVITQSTSLAELLNWGMLQWSEFENEMTSVERIIQYKDTDSEDDPKSDQTWPKSSSIKFQGVYLKYKEDIPPALNDLNFTVARKEKIGIVGRTGAGKTSIISALFRLVNFEGDVLIGDVSIKKVPLETVRSKISIIPQDPVLFSGTVRENLDPFVKFTDSDLWAILDDLELRCFVSQLPAGLDSIILEKGANLSVGQRQLFCLARALLRKNDILVLDEATASVDYRTDLLIQDTIKKKLVDCTVLIIAHRLQTIMDCDKVLVMETGRNLEFDHPYKLLQDQHGALYNLVSKTGQGMTEHLKQIARKNYTERCE